MTEHIPLTCLPWRRSNAKHGGLLVHLVICYWDLTFKVVLCSGAQEEGLRVFFRPFLIVHLAPNTDTDGYLGFMPPKRHALL